MRRIALVKLTRMKLLFLYPLLIALTLACSNEQNSFKNYSYSKEFTTMQNQLFSYISSYPSIEDSISLIFELKKLSAIDYNDSKIKDEIITYYKNVKLYGSEKSYHLLEYSYRISENNNPEKLLVLLTHEGKFLQKLFINGLKLIETFYKQNPFLITMKKTTKGNGGHNLYKISNDKLELVLDAFNNEPRTFDAHQDNSIYEPNELNLEVKDYNNDGYNDIAFNGQIVYIQGQNKNGIWYDCEVIEGEVVYYSVDNPYKKTPIEYIFLYDKETGHFTALENKKIQN